METNKQIIISAIALAVGLVGSALLISNGLSHLKSNNRYVTVRGLNEQDAITL
jgi:hypothetical protein